MRLCSRCRSEDRRLMRRSENCTCGQGMWAGDEDHGPDCHMVAHWVVIWPFPKPLRERDLVKDEDAEHGYLLPQKWRKDWKLVERPGVKGQYVRIRTLCRDCIQEELSIAERVKEYETRSERYAGKGKLLPWAKSIAQQDTF